MRRSWEKPIKGPCESGHIVDREGMCRECGKIVGPFDLMAARRHLQDGLRVRLASWPAGSFLALRDGKVMLRYADGTPLAGWRFKEQLSLAEVFGDWELAE